MIRIFSKLHQWTTGWFMVFFIRKYFYKLLTYIWFNLTSFISSSAGWNCKFVSLVCCEATHHGGFIVFSCR
jgi:hypothetical protein